MTLFCPKCGACLAELPPTNDDESIEGSGCLEIKEASRFSAEWASTNPRLRFFGLARCIFCRAHFTISVPQRYVDQQAGQYLGNQHETS